MRAYGLAFLLLIAIFGAIGGYLYQRFSAFSDMDFSPPPVTIAAAEATLTERGQYLDAVGTIMAVRGVQLTSETSGEITAIHFDSGETVGAGQLLVVLNDEVEQASKRSEQASLELAEILFNRDSQLIEKKSIPQSQFDRSRADLQRARAQLTETKARIANKRIQAPFSGVMGIRLVDAGDYLSPGAVIATLQDPSELEIDFTVPAQRIPLLKPGLAISLSVAAYPERDFPAKLIAIDSRADPQTRNVLIRARLTDMNGLLPGMFATVKVDLDQSEERVTVPETAITYSLQGDTVYVINPTNEGKLTAEARIVKLGTARDGRMSVLAGIEPGERVVTAGQNKLYRGVQVLVDESVAL